ncbi:hypothetical protein [Roseovarius albus]|nr:hypothetical protein [Roseovarius albus]
MTSVVKIIKLYEAKHELKQGSAGWISSISGWSVIGFWILATWFLTSIIGDWHSSGDLSGAGERSVLRLRVVLEIAMALAHSD